MKNKFTRDDSIEMLTNPIYTGMGPYQAIVSDEQWLDANVRMIEEEGAKSVIESILKQFKDTLTHLSTLDAEPYAQLAKSNPRAALSQLLADLRDLAQEESE